MNSITTLLGRLSWPYALRHVLRIALTVLSVVLGVALFLSIHTVNQAVVEAFRGTVNQVAGSTQLQISAGETGLAEEVLDQVQSVPGVRVATPVIEAVITTELKGHSLLLLGVDMTGDSNLRDYNIQEDSDGVEADPLVMLAQPNSIVITKVVSEENGLGVGSTFSAKTIAGNKTLKVTGIMNPGGLANAFGGRIAAMDIYAAQKLLGRGRRFDRIDLGLENGKSVEEVQKALANHLGSGYQVDRPSARGEQFDSLIRVYSLTSGLTSVFALVVGMFIIYNTLQTSVVQRRVEIGVLRALGATRDQVRWWFLAEGALIGLVGALVGCLCGILLARAMGTNISTLIRELYGVAEHVDKIGVNPAIVGVAVALGTLTSMLAAWVPAREASQISPIMALHRNLQQEYSAGAGRFRTLLGASAIFMSWLCWFFSAWRPVLYLSDVLAILAMLLIIPVYARGFGRTVRPALQWLWPVEGRLAVDGFVRSSRRNSGVIAALALAFGFVIVTAGIARANRDAIYDWATAAFDADLLVSPNQGLTARTFQFPGEMLEQLQGIPSIAKVEGVRSARITWHGTTALLVAADEGALRSWAAGALPRSASQALPTGAIVSDNFAVPHGLKQGDTLELPSPDGVLQLPILAVIRSYFDQQGCIFIEREIYRQHWHDSSVSIFRVFVKPESTVTETSRRILEKFGADRTVFVLSSAEVRKFVTDIVDKWNNVSYIPVAIAILIAVLGIINTLTVSITDRRREISVLRAIGAERTQVRLTVWSEALIIGMAAFLLGLIMGGLQLYYDLETSVRYISGNVLAYRYPFILALQLLPLIAVAAVISAIGPAEAALRNSLVEGLEYE